MSKISLGLEYGASLARRFFGRGAKPAIETAQTVPAKIQSMTRTLRDPITGKVTGLEREIKLEGREKGLARIDYLGEGKRKITIFNENNFPFLWETKAITREEGGSVFGGSRINIDKGRFWYNEGMIEETPDSTSDTFQNIADTIRKIAEIIRKDNIGFSVKEENGEIIIKPIKVEKQLNDYPLDMPVMVSDDLKYWQLAYYYSRKSVYSSGKSSKDAPDSYSNYKYTIPFSQFDPKNIEESLKHNIVPKKLKQ